MANVMTSLRMIGLALALAAPVAAQDAPASRPQPVDRTELRHQIYVFEGALARAVEFGAQQLNRELRSVMPDAFMLAGDAQARGVYLEGYGIFVDVEVPMLRQSMIWSLRMMLEQDNSGARGAAAEIRRLLQGVTDPATRASLESALRRLEAQAPTVVGGLPQPVGQPSRGQTVGAMVLPDPAAASGAPPASGAAAGVNKTWLQDPNRAYTEAVQKALVDTMIDYSPPRAIGPDEWLTVAARDNEQRDTLAPPDPWEEIVTVLLRIKGSDLMAYRSGGISREEARKRVSIGQF